MSRKIFFRWLKLVIIIYCAIGIAFYYLQDYILFHPEPFSKNAKYNFTDSYKEVNIPYDKETTLNIVQFIPKDEPLQKEWCYIFMATEKIFRGMQNMQPTLQKIIMKFGCSIILVLEKAQENLQSKDYMIMHCRFTNWQERDSNPSILLFTEKALAPASRRS